MYLTRLHVKNVKLLRALSLDFTHENRPRMWTVFVSESGTCKTALLQAIALAASGVDRASRLADVASLPDARRPSEPVRISADFEFGSRLAPWRRFPEPNLFVTSREPLRLRSTLGFKSGQTRFSGDSWFAPRDVLASVSDDAPQLNAEALLAAFQGKSRASSLFSRPPQLSRLSGSDSVYFWQMVSYAFTPRDQMTEARARGLPGWLVAGYGARRQLPAPSHEPEFKERVINRLEPLFGHASPLSTGFTQTLAHTQSLQPYVEALRRLFVDDQLLPHVEGVELGPLDEAAASTQQPPPPPGLTFLLGQQKTRLPAHWLSQAYQSTLAWIADFIGQMYLDIGRPVPFEDMEGLVLIDEPDLHLPLGWQGQLVPVLRRVFPRMQFILATHSSALLPAFEPHEVVMLRMNEHGDVVAEPSTLRPRPPPGEPNPGDAPRAS